jgi:hypothetical protein
MSARGDLMSSATVAAVGPDDEDDSDEMILIDDEDGDVGTDEDLCARDRCSHLRSSHEGGSGVCSECPDGHKGCPRFVG